ncbi:MAG: peptidase [Candidatus Acidoferrum typicum]|nr:peptidase [Candidatus Acidoferrum typicum]
MWRIREPFSRTATGSALRLGLLALVAITIIGSAYFSRHHAQFVMAARPGLDGPDIELLERQDKAYERVIQATSPAVVYIRTEQVIKADQSPLFMDPWLRQFFGNQLQIPREQRQHALGTGVLFDSNGYIVTNNHVIDKATTIQVMLNDKRVFKAKVIGADPDIDVAVVKIDNRSLPTIPLGDSSNLHVGDTVMAFGNPFGLNFTVTRGTVSALGRSQGNIEQVQDFIQTDAAINPGNSGGPLVDVRGEMVGINTAILSPGGQGETAGSVGIGFAIPINMAKRAMESLIKTGKVTRGFLGATIGPVTPELAQEFKAPDTSGALVQDVSPGGPAAKAGLKPGDVIRKFNGQTVGDSAELLAMVASTNPGTPVTLEILRNGQPQTVNVTLEQRPGNLAYAGGPSRSPNQGVLRGVTVQNLTSDLRKQLGVPSETHGVVVTEIDPGSPAAQYLTQGDIIMSINRHDVNSVADFNKLAAEAKGQTLLRIMRQGQAAFVVIPDQAEGQ